jgi:two-component system cell cycle response regulator CtrA
MFRKFNFLLRSVVGACKNETVCGGYVRILVIEDEELIANGIRSSCIAEGFVCHVAYNGNDGIDMLKFYDYDIVILDLILPDVNGFEVLETIKRSKKDVSVMVLSAITSVDDKVKCLSNGADDYLTKPFSKVELLARVYAIMRRMSGLRLSVIEIGPLSLDFGSRIVTINGDEVPLTSKEYSMLELLALKRGSIITKETFLNHIYGGMDEPDMKIVDVFICKLRKKMADASGGLNFIETIWGRGYTLKENPTEMESSKHFNNLMAG